MLDVTGTLLCTGSKALQIALKDQYQSWLNRLGGERVGQARSQNGILGEGNENLGGNGFALGAISKEERRSSKNEELILFPNYGEDQKQNKKKVFTQ